MIGSIPRFLEGEPASTTVAARRVRKAASPVSCVVKASSVLRWVCCGKVGNCWSSKDAAPLHSLNLSVSQAA